MESHPYGDFSAINASPYTVADGIDDAATAAMAKEELDQNIICKGTVPSKYSKNLTAFDCSYTAVLGYTNRTYNQYADILVYHSKSDMDPVRVNSKRPAVISVQPGKQLFTPRQLKYKLPVEFELDDARKGIARLVHQISDSSNQTNGKARTPVETFLDCQPKA